MCHSTLCKDVVILAADDLVTRLKQVILELRAYSMEAHS